MTGLTATGWVLEPILIAAAWGPPLIPLLMGGCTRATAMAASGPHRRVAVVRARGRGRRNLAPGVMLATASSSVGIRCPATVSMRSPVAVALLAQDPRPDGLGVPLLPGIARAAGIGGPGSPAGTPPHAMIVGADRAPMPETVRRGAALHIAGAVLLAGLCAALPRGSLV